MVHICSVHSYLIWKANKQDRGHRSHRQYRSAVALGRLQTPFPEKPILSTNIRRCSNHLPPVSTKALSHNWVQWETRRHCVWCKIQNEQWVPKRPPVLREIINQSTPGKRKRQ
jgi:hypothetical protein